MGNVIGHFHLMCLIHGALQQNLVQYLDESLSGYVFITDMSITRICSNEYKSKTLQQSMQPVSALTLKQNYSLNFLQERLPAQFEHEKETL